MIRIRKPNGWWLLRHADHAALAGQFADHWGNEEFRRPEPFAQIREGVARHDDAWIEPDALPRRLPEGTPAAFSQELVGTYAAFEGIDLADYLAVRGQATEAVARDAPYGAILVSMHTVNLLTEQADLSTLSDAERALHSRFIAAQRTRQAELAATLAAESGMEEELEEAVLDRAFRFLQACDSLSLTVCVQFPKEIDLRHAHPTRSGGEKIVRCFPLGADRYRLDPYPFDQDTLEFAVPYRELGQVEFSSTEALRAAYAEAPVQHLPLTLSR